VGTASSTKLPVGKLASYGTYLPQGIYGARLLFFVSARTNKRHHHHVDAATSSTSRMAFRLALPLILAARHRGRAWHLVLGKSFGSPLAFIEVSGGEGGDPLYLLVLKYTRYGT
jgi:hypothetical protein